MKSTIIFSLAFFIILPCFWSCEGEQTPKVASVKSAAIFVPDSCMVPEYRSGEYSQRLSGECAATFINNYESFIGTVEQNANVQNGPEKLIRGAHVDQEELLKVLEQLEEDSTSQLFIMTGMKGDTADFIFTIQTTDNDKHNYVYYDFTMPCPNYCPKKYE